jgi:hypothetical protein
MVELRSGKGCDGGTGDGGSRVRGWRWRKGSESGLQRYSSSDHVVSTSLNLTLTMNAF